MFAKKFRLPSSIKFLGKPIFSTSFYTLKRGTNNLGFNRYGFIVSKRLDKRATVRNRARRMVRSCFEELKDSIITGYDFLVIIKKDAIDKEREIVLNETKQMLINNKMALF